MTREGVWVNGLLMGMTIGFLVGGLTVEFFSARRFRKVMIEHGAAYYDGRSGKFTVIELGEQVK